jgi:hypothetical protein
MSNYCSVRRAMRAIPTVAFACFAMMACDTDSLGPPAPAAPALSQGVGVQTVNVKPGLYPYSGCFTEASSLYGAVGAPPKVFFDPPICLRATLEIFEDGRWTVWLPYNSTPPQHPDWAFSSFDEVSWTSRDGECRGAFQTGSLISQTCVTEPRYVRKMTFSNAADASRFGTWYRASVKYTYSPGHSSKTDH